MASPAAADDASTGAGRRCGWCRLAVSGPRATRWCSKRCRQTAWRLRKLGVVSAGADDAKPLRLAYADPPYIGLSKKYYGKQPSFKGEVDHEDLVRRLSLYDGWALSCSRNSLRYLLTLVPAGVYICPWIKSRNPSPARGPSNIHEYVLVAPGRRRRPGPPDAYYGGHPWGGGAADRPEAAQIRALGFRAARRWPGR